MKTKLVLPILIYAIFLTACGGVTPYPTPLAVSPTLAIPTISLPTTTSTPTLTPIPWKTPMPETFNGYPTAQSVPPTPTVFDLPKGFEVQREDFSIHDLYFGKYVVRKWCGRKGDYFKACAITISSLSEKQIEIWGFPAYLRDETGIDLSGNGKPDIVIGVGNGNCCVETIIYETGDTLEKILDVWSQDPGTFTDLNDDGSLEYIAPTRIWSRFCLTCQAWFNVIYEYQGKIGYVPATYKFKDKLPSTQEPLDFLAQFTKQHPNMAFHFLSVKWDPNNLSEDDKEIDQYNEETNWEYSRAVNTLYDITIYYLLAGQKSDAQKILNEYFPPDKASEYMVEIQKDLRGLLAP